MLTSNYNNSLLNYGDMYRIRKYCKVFKNWDLKDNQNNPVYMIYPEILTLEVFYYYFII